MSATFDSGFTNFMGIGLASSTTGGGSNAGTRLTVGVVDNSADCACICLIVC